MKKTIVALIISIIGINAAFPQMECRSMLGSKLTPFKEGGSVLWAIEGTMAPGIMTSPFDSLDNTRLNGGMLLGALDFGIKSKSHIYIEGGFKNWKNSEFVNVEEDGKVHHLAVRQFFYSYASDNTKIKLGLHETRMGNYFLVDERVVGASVDQNIGAFTLNMRAATVLKGFARMGKFCANRHLYGLVNNGNYTEHIGKKPGETNMAGIVFNWNPHYQRPQQSGGGDEFESTDEFETTDEFHENHDFSEFGGGDEFSSENTGTSQKQKIKLTNVGFIIYDEFGSDAYIPDNKFYSGIMTDYDLPYDFFAQAGFVYQYMSQNNTAAYILRLGRSKLWDNSSLTKISAAYIGKVDVDKSAIFQPLFSNLFIGEVMRMDAPQFPLWQAAIKHKFPGKRKFHLAAKFAGQIEGNETNEQDIEVGMMLFKNHFKMTLIGSHVKTLALPNDFMMVRLEMRLAF